MEDCRLSGRANHAAIIDALDNHPEQARPLSEGTKMDPRRLNDRVFLGVKSHGGTDA
jgi:hypothetical protein